jgi:Rod binding domain-containing protein
MRRGAMVAALIAAAAHSGAQAADTCMTVAEGSAMMAVAMPAVVRQARTSCQPHLKADAVLLTRTDSLIARLKPEADKAWPVAMRYFGRSAGVPMPDGDATRQFVEAMLTAGITQQLTSKLNDPKGCGIADGMVQALEPLPAENWSLLATQLMRIGAAGKEAATICPE